LVAGVFVVVVVVVVPVVVPVVSVVVVAVVDVDSSVAGVSTVAVVDVVVVSSTTFGASVVVSRGASDLAQPIAVRREADTATRATIERNFFMSISFFRVLLIAEISEFGTFFPGRVSRSGFEMGRNTLNDGAGAAASFGRKG
jgi:hypothetical protein